MRDNKLLPLHIINGIKTTFLVNRYNWYRHISGPGLSTFAPEAPGSMGDSTDGAIFNKCDPVIVGISSTVSLQNRLFVLIVNNINKTAQIK